MVLTPGSPSRPVTSERERFSIGALGGATTVIDVHGLRIVSDPTFDRAGAPGYLRRTTDPTTSASDLGPVDIVLISHDGHSDNLDASGRAFALAAPLVITTPTAAATLGPRAVGLRVWETYAHEASGMLISRVPAHHAPVSEADGTQHSRDEVAGFLMRTPMGRTIYVSGDNASLNVVDEVRHFAEPDPVHVAVLHAGAEVLPDEFGGRTTTLTPTKAASAAELLNALHVVVVHQDSWSHYTSGPEETVAAFHDAGLEDVLLHAPNGTWNRIGPVMHELQGFDA